MCLRAWQLGIGRVFGRHKSLKNEGGKTWEEGQELFFLAGQEGPEHIVVNGLAASWRVSLRLSHGGRSTNTEADTEKILGSDLLNNMLHAIVSGGSRRVRGFEGA